MKKTILYILFSILFFATKEVSAQCNLGQSATTVCAGEGVSFWVTNKSDAFDYQFRIEGTDLLGDSITWAFSGQNTDRNALVRILRRPKGTTGAFQNCCCAPQATIKVRASPDPTLEFLSGSVTTDGTIVNCGASFGSPDFDLEISNASKTPGGNGNYTVDWGDGTPIFSDNAMTTLNHTYTSIGFFDMKFTVKGSGSAGCNEVTRTYTIFNGSDPDISINAPAIKRELCLQEGIRYEITNVNTNTVGTTYEILLNGEIIDKYNHPPPKFYDLLFDKTSCNESYQGIVGAYIFEIRAINPCLTTPVFQTDGPITVGDTLIPLVQIKDTICVNTITEISNITDNYNVMENCERVKYGDWKIFPDTGWVLTSTVPASPLNFIQKEKIRVNFTSIGVYNVRMIVENECRLKNFKDSIDTVIVVIDEPVPDAIVELGDGCAPDSLKLINQSTGIINSYKWSITPSGGVEFINGTKATDRDAEIFIKNGGNYKIMMTAKNKCRQKSWEETVSIISKPEILLDPIEDKCNSFTFTPNLKGDFVNAFVTWTFDGASNITSFVGVQPPPITWDKTGDFFVEVAATTSCGMSTIKHEFKVVTLAPPKLSNDTLICLKSSPFNLKSSLPGGTWSGLGISDSLLGTFSPNTLSGIGTYVVFYKYEGALCSVSDSVIIKVVTVEDIYAGDSLLICIDDLPIALSGNTPSGGSWFGEGITNALSGVFNPKLVVTNPSSVGYTYSDLNGCTDTAFRIVSVIGPEELHFPSFNDTICLSDSVAFDLSSVNKANSLSWDMGDGTIIKGKYISHIYKTPGIFTIILTAEWDGGCKSHIDTTIFVKEKPFINVLFSPKSGCGELPVQFNTQITNTAFSGTTYTYQWNFGDGNTSIEKDPLNNYKMAVVGDTSYVFRTLVRNSCGTAFYRDTVKVFKPPFTRFGTSKKEYCSREEVVIFNSSSLNATYYQWNFGNGQTSSDRNPVNQIYPSLTKDSIFTITLKAGNLCGEATFYQKLTIKANTVVAGFQTAPVKGCAPLLVSFKNFATTPGSALIWDLGDGNTAFSQDSIKHLYTKSGQFTASLTADNGCKTDTKTQLIEVLPSPNVTFDFNQRACVGDQVLFTNNTTGTTGYQWSFGDGLGSILVSPSHIYNFEGVYKIKLVAKTTGGCSDSLTRVIEVFDRPIAAFVVLNKEICANSLVQIINNSVDGTSFLWNFGDNNFSLGFSPLKIYEEAGIYPITLIVDNANTCRDTLTIENAIRVFEKPFAGFDYIQTGGNDLLGEIQFDNLSIGASIFNWDLGDGTFTDEVNPFHHYLREGNIRVQLISENNFGCTDTSSRIILVEFLGELFLPNAFTPDIGTSETSIFKPKGFGLRSYKIEIYSTYGELLWSSTAIENGAPTEGWDGTFKGTPLPQDVYVWKIIAVFENGKSWAGIDDKGGKTTNIGSLLLIR